MKELVSNDDLKVLEKISKAGLVIDTDRRATAEDLLRLIPLSWYDAKDIRPSPTTTSVEITTPASMGGLYPRGSRP